MVTKTDFLTKKDAVIPVDEDQSKVSSEDQSKVSAEDQLNERYLYDLYKTLEAAEESENEAAQLKAFKNLQNYYISQESGLDKIGVAYESAMQGTNKGISVGIGLPVDIVNIVLVLN